MQGVAWRLYGPRGVFSMMDVRRSTFLFTAFTAISLAACSGEDGGSDAGATNVDAVAHDDAAGFMLPDVTRPDAQPARDALVEDAGERCLANGTLPVEGTQVMAGTPPAAPKSPTDMPSTLMCGPKTNPIPAKIRFHGCLPVVGAAATRAEIDALQIAVFLAKDPDTQMPTDPTYDTRGVDRAPITSRLSPAIEIVENAATCGGGIEFTLGRDAIDAQALSPDVDYIIRTRSATVGANANVWVDQYHYNVNIDSDRLERGTDPANCFSAQDCSGRVDLVLVKRTALQALVTASGVAIDGAANLNDHVGSGHALVQMYDCLDAPMQNVAAGFSPAPAARSYLTDTLAFSAAGSGTTKSGAVLGLGFTGTSSATPRAIAVGATLSTDGTCALPWAGRKIPVYSDALTMFKLGRTSRIDD